MSKLAQPLNVYGYASVNSDGSINYISPNLAFLHAGTGNYIFTPADVLDTTVCLPMAVAQGGTPGICSCSFGLGPSSRGIQVATFNGAGANAPAQDESFFFILYTVGANARSAI